MTIEWTSLLLLGFATFAGALIQAATGFGFAIVAAPVFLWVMNSTAAIAVLVALHVVQSVLIVPSLWAKASGWHLKRFAFGALAGGPFGLWLLARMDVQTLKLSVGIVILAAIGLLIWREFKAGARPIVAGRSSTPAAVLTGAISGALTALLVMPGPPLMVYFMRERHAGDAIRALSLSFFAVCYVAVTAAQAFTSAFDTRAMTAVACLSPAVILGTVSGVALQRHVSEVGLRMAILALLFLSGLGAVVSAVSVPA